jgi:hypothetical protein
MEDVGIFYGHFVYICYGNLIYFMVIWYIFTRFDLLYQEKSENPELIQQHEFVDGKVDTLFSSNSEPFHRHEAAVQVSEAHRTCFDCRSQDQMPGCVAK